jgi:hypothetical protein
VTLPQHKPTTEGSEHREREKFSSLLTLILVLAEIYFFSAAMQIRIGGFSCIKPSAFRCLTLAT